MPVLGISEKEASCEGITTILESKDRSLEEEKNTKFQKICKKTLLQISCLSYASGNDESQGRSRFYAKATVMGGCQKSPPPDNPSF